MNTFCALVVACIIAFVAAECPSACSGHGTCGAYDACSCFRNWMSNDCSERICPFGLAHVDTPLGDLDASSGQLTGPGSDGAAGSAGDLSIIADDAMYPTGTTEQFPAMKDTGGTVKENSAHYYRECSNKGICDRSSGECECFDGYDGSSCQRASCPTSSNGVCSGHGTCRSIQELAGDDNENVYRLWDEDITMGCSCDSGYTGSDCSSRSCKMGSDPLYSDDFANVRHANFTVQFYIMNDDAEIYGNYSLVFTDIYGEDWQTEPIDIDANCAVIQDRLESLPNDVVPANSVKCYKSEETLHVASDTSTANTAATGTSGALGTSQNAVTGQDSTLNFRSGLSQFTTESSPTGELIYSAFNFSIVNKYILAFPGNPGDIAPLKVNRYLDGKRPTLFTTEKGLQTLGTHIYSNGFHGENTDYVNDECEGVLVGLSSDTVDHTSGTVADTKEKLTHYLAIDTDLEFERLKRCLGDADGVTTNNIEVYDWDYGNFMNPHLIKLVDATQDRYIEYIRADGTSYKVLSPGDTPSGTGDGWESFPMTKLCSKSDGWLKDNYLLGNAIHKLLFQDDLNDATASGGDVFNRGTHGWCKNPNPPGFFAIIYFDDCTTEGVTKLHHVVDAGTTVAADTEDNTEMCSINKKGFRVLTRPATDYKTTTRFHVYTTKGTLQQVSQHSGAYTTNYAEKFMLHDGTQGLGMLNPDFIHNFHSNVIHVSNTTFTGAQGQIDCETATDANGQGKYGNLDCLNKGDKIFLVNLGDRDASNCEGSRTYTNIGGFAIGATDNCYYKTDTTSFDSNPMYPNMYTVKKIGKIAKDINAADHAAKVWKRVTPATVFTADQNPIHSEGYRHQITLDMGVNAMYIANSASLTADANQPDMKATIYKFHPPSLSSTGTTGYNYVGECSNRGICDSDSGICGCFSGYHGDDCSIVNSLAE